MNQFSKIFTAVLTMIAGVIAGVAVAAPAKAHPFDAPQLGDIQGLYYNGGNANSSNEVVASGLYIGDKPASFALRVGPPNSESYVVQDAVTIVNGEVAKNVDGVVKVKKGDAFSIIHRNDERSGVYQLWTSYTSDSEVGTTIGDVALLAQWNFDYDIEVDPGRPRS